MKAGTKPHFDKVAMPLDTFFVEAPKASEFVINDREEKIDPKQKSVALYKQLLGAFAGWGMWALSLKTLIMFI